MLYNRKDNTFRGITMTEEQSNTNRKEFDSSQEQLASAENITLTSPPVFSGFEILKTDSEGFFIINPTDGSIFKWINTNALKCNGKFDDKKGFFKNGRRNFEGYIWNFFNDSSNGHPEYVESDDFSFKAATQMFGGFYISAYRARMDKEGNLFFADNGPTLDCINFAVANNNAKLYADTFAINKEFISALPCGAAMDCVSEEIYERFEKEVLIVLKCIPLCTTKILDTKVPRILYLITIFFFIRLLSNFSSKYGFFRASSL